MPDPTPRLFADDAAVRRVGEGLLARTLPREEWTHEAHLAATVWLLRERPDIDLDAEIAGIISRYNAAVGGVNDDTGGYHDTITRTYLAGVLALLAGRDADDGLTDAVNAVLTAPVGARDWPLRYYTPDRLFSVAARRGFTPDVMPIP